MGVALDLRIIDHERIVVRGLEAVNDAIRHQDPERLRSYLGGFPVDVDPEVVAFREARLLKLRELQAPAIIIQNDEKFLRLAKGEAYRPEELQKAKFDELRQLLGTWCWITHSFCLDKTWDELHWFLLPAAGPKDSPVIPHRVRLEIRGNPSFPRRSKAPFTIRRTILAIRSFAPLALLSRIVQGTIRPQCVR